SLDALDWLHHMITTDVEIIEKQCEEFYVTKFLFGLYPSPPNVKVFFQGDDSIPSLSIVYARVRGFVLDSYWCQNFRKGNSSFVSALGGQDSDCVVVSEVLVWDIIVQDSSFSVEVVEDIEVDRGCGFGRSWSRYTGHEISV
ncbi:unnamed protein product, partial [Ilex paraguariensis]